MFTVPWQKKKLGFSATVFERNAREGPGFPAMHAMCFQHNDTYVALRFCLESRDQMELIPADSDCVGTSRH